MPPVNPAPRRQIRPKLTEGRLRSLRLAWQRDRLSLVMADQQFLASCVEREVKHPRKEARRLVSLHGLEQLIGKRAPSQSRPPLF